MDKNEAIKLAADSVGFSSKMLDIVEFMSFVNRTEAQMIIRNRAAQKFMWDVKTYNELVKRTHENN